MSIFEQILVKNKKALGNRVKEIRLAKNLSQLDVASMCKYEKTTISRIENGRTNITIKTLVTLSIILDVELKDFFDFKIDLTNERGL